MKELQFWFRLALSGAIMALVMIEAGYSEVKTFAAATAATMFLSFLWQVLLEVGIMRFSAATTRRASLLAWNVLTGVATLVLIVSSPEDGGDYTSRAACAAQTTIAVLFASALIGGLCTRRKFQLEGAV